jgi:ribonuclease P protein component
MYLKLPREKLDAGPSSGNACIPEKKLFVFPAKCMVSVSSRRFKKAVDRNLIKRRFREAYRKNKSEFYSFLDQKGYNCLLAFMYTGKQIATFAEMDSKIAVSLQKLMEILPNEQFSE